MIESHHIEEFKIKTYDTDFKHRLRIEALFNYFQEVAEIHSNHGNVGYIGMQRRNMIWILSKVRVHINALPKVNESIQIKTWSRGVDRLFAYRDFSVTNGNNKNIINASSAWLIIDKIKHRPIRPEIFADGFPTKNQQSDKFCFNKIIY